MAPWRRCALSSGFGCSGDVSLLVLAGLEDSYANLFQDRLPFWSLKILEVMRYENAVVRVCRDP